MADTDPPRQAGTGPSTPAPDAVNNEARRLALNLIREELRETSRRQALLNLVRRAAQWIGRRLAPGRSTPQDFAAQYAPAASPSRPDYGAPQQWPGGGGWEQERSMQPFQPGPGAYGPGPGPGAGGFAQGPPAQQFGQQFGQGGFPAPGQELSNPWQQQLERAVRAQLAELLRTDYKAAADKGRLPRAQWLAAASMSEVPVQSPQRENLQEDLLGVQQGTMAAARDRASRPATAPEPAAAAQQQAPPAPEQQRADVVSSILYPSISRRETPSGPQPSDAVPPPQNATTEQAENWYRTALSGPSRFERPPEMEQRSAATYTGTDQHLSAAMASDQARGAHQTTTERTSVTTALPTGPDRDLSAAMESGRAREAERGTTAEQTSGTSIAPFHYLNDARTVESVEQRQRPEQKAVLETPSAVTPNVPFQPVSPLPRSPIGPEGQRVLATPTPTAPGPAASSSATPPPPTVQAANTAGRRHGGPSK